MTLQAFNIETHSKTSPDLLANIDQTSVFLKAIAHEGRLAILCRLSEGEASVTDLENLLSARQAAVSQQLARLRQEGLVSARRQGKAIYYSLVQERVQSHIKNLHHHFCRD